MSTVNLSLISRVFIIVCLSCLPVAAQNAAPEEITTVEGITEYRLSNGLDVLLFPDNSKQTVTVNVTYLVGSRHEGSGEGGMAHLLEHMLFQGTERRAQLIPEIREHGASFNGTTSWDRTNYFETMPANDENLHWALDMEADRMVNSRVSQVDLDSEMTVVRNEFESGENSPLRVLQERVMSAAYLWHGYGRSPIGSRSDIEHVPIDRLQAFYRKYYQPDNAVLIVAGNFDATQTLRWIEETFGAIPRPERVLENTYTEEPVQDGEREVTLRRVGDIQSLILAYHIPAAAHKDMAALEVLASILSDNPSGRLYKALVDGGQAVATGAGAMARHDPSLFTINALLREGQSLDTAETTTFSVIDGLISEPPSTEEVERAKAGLLKNIELAFNDSTNLALGLSQSVASGDWRLLFTNRDEIREVTPQDVERVAKQYLKSSNRTIGRFIPEEEPDRSEIPPTPDLVSKLEGYTGRTDIRQGEDFDPTPANIEARVVRVTLPGGLKLSMLPKQTRGGMVVGRLDIHFGNEENLFGKSMIGQMAGSLLMRGSSEHNRQQIQDELDRLQAQANVLGSAQGALAMVQTKRESLIPTLRLVAEILKTPTFPESELEQLRQLRLASLENSLKEPSAIASRAMSRHLNPYEEGDVRETPSVEDERSSIESVTIDQVRQFHKDFYGASTAEMSLVGDFDAAEVQAAMEELFGSWTSPAEYDQVKRVAQGVEVVDEDFDTPDKTNAYTFAGLTFPMDDLHEDYVELTLANRILGGSPDSRMFQRIREQEGLSYGAQTGLSVATDEPYAQFSFFAISNPENAARVKEVFLEEMNKAYTEGFSADEVATEVDKFRQDNAVQRSQDSFLASTLARYDRYDRTMQRLQEILDEASSATAEEVNAAFRRWVDPEKLSIFQAGDFGEDPPAGK